MPEKLTPLMIIDSKMNTVIVELEPWQFKQLQIKTEDVKKHKSRRALNAEISEYLGTTVNN
jgi:hypothetical protein